jgi:hypothetical protein
VATWIWFVLAAVGLAAIAMFFMRRPSGKSVMAAARAGDVAPIVASIESGSGDSATRWDHAISELWSTYHRETAALLVVEAAHRSDDDIVQYWIAQVIQVEPDIARVTFTQEFLTEHFRPDVASRCGRKGCCG